MWKTILCFSLFCSSSVLLSVSSVEKSVSSPAVSLRAFITNRLLPCLSQNDQAGLAALCTNTCEYSTFETVTSTHKKPRSRAQWVSNSFNEFWEKTIASFPVDITYTHSGVCTWEWKKKAVVADIVCTNGAGSPVTLSFYFIREAGVPKIKRIVRQGQ